MVLIIIAVAFITVVLVWIFCGLLHKTTVQKTEEDREQEEFIQNYLKRQKEKY